VNGNGEDRWHERPTLVSVLAAAGGVLVALIAVWGLMIEPRKTVEVGLEKEIATLRSELSDEKTRQNANWAHLPDINTVVERQAASGEVAKGIQEQLKEHDSKFGHDGITKMAATLEKGLDGERIAREASDQASLDMRHKIQDQLDRVDAEQSRLRERLASLEARVNIVHPAYTVREPKEGAEQR